jgi:hypothetical protein
MVAHLAAAVQEGDTGLTLRRSSAKAGNGVNGLAAPHDVQVGPQGMLAKLRTKATDVVGKARALAFCKTAKAREQVLGTAEGLKASLHSLNARIQHATKSISSCAAEAAVSAGSVRAAVLAACEHVRVEGGRTCISQLRDAIPGLMASGRLHAGEAHAAARVSVRNSVLHARTRASQSWAQTREAIGAATSHTKARAASAAEAAQVIVADAGAATRKAAGDAKVQATAAGALGGAAALGSGAGAAGLAAGSVAGAMVGLVPALFTFGASIPICAVLGGGAGLAVGTAAGSVVGALGGAIAGYGTYTNRGKLQERMQWTVNTANGCADAVKSKGEAARQWVTLSWSVHGAEAGTAR